MPTTLPHREIICAIVFGTYVLYRYIRRARARRLTNPRGLPLPPGPKPLPLIGNLLDLPRSRLPQTFFKWGEEYGDLVHISVLGQHLIIINSTKVAHDLFEKRSSNYSDRGRSLMINELMGWDWSFGHMAYGERWKAHRKTFHKFFQPSAISVQHPVHISEAHTLLRRILEDPNRYESHLKQHASSTVMKVVYDIDVEPKDDRYIVVAEEALDGMAKAASPGAFLVDFIPILKYVPEWVPGAGFQRKAREWRAKTLEMRDAPFEATRKALAQGKAGPCYVASLLNDMHGKEQTFVEGESEIDVIRGSAGMAYAAATEPTVSSFMAFALAMILHPAVQERAQKELDSVLEQKRLPDFSDRPSLPYINAIVKEVLRWSQVAPMALPHLVTADDTYNGYFIPAGTMVIGNTWGILHDSNVYPDPFAFKPERFLDTSLTKEQQNVDFAFGYGRRICAGRFMSDAQLFIMTASLLSVFSFEKGIGEKNLPEAKFTDGMISHPEPFKYSIKLRGDYAKSLIEQTA